MYSSASQAMIATNAILIVVAGISVILRLYVRKHQSLPLKKDDCYIVGAWVRDESRDRFLVLTVVGILSSFSNNQYSRGSTWWIRSTVCVPERRKGHRFLKGKLADFGLNTTTDNPPDSICLAILVHFGCLTRQAVRALLLWPDIFFWQITHLGQDPGGHHDRLADFFSFRYLLSNMADLVQLDRLQAHNQLSGHVCSL